MKLHLLLLLAFTLPLFVGCADKDTSTVADVQDIAAYVAAHPESDADMTPEGGDQ